MRARATLYGLALLAAGAAAGCADGASAPTEVTPAAPRIAMHLGGSGGAISTTVSGDSIIDVITVRGDKGGDFRIGGQHWIHFPQNAICDPAASSYGPREWDAPCTPTEGRVTITAVSYRDARGHPRIDFEPALRFVPSQRSQGWVVLAMADSAALKSAQPLISYCGPGGCVDESLSDGSLVTHKSLKQGFAFRRIKHFSGYLISAGRVGLEAY